MIVQLARRTVSTAARLKYSADGITQRPTAEWRLAIIRGMFAASKLTNAGKALRVGSGFYVTRRKDGTVTVGDNVRILTEVRLNLDAPGATIAIGSRTFLNRNTQIFCLDSVTIGDDCAISCDVSIFDSDYHALNGSRGTKPVHIGNHVWLGNGAKVLKGVTIGDGCVVAAGSIVTRDLPPNTLAAGSPARVISETVTWEI